MFVNIFLVMFMVVLEDFEMRLMVYVVQFLGVGSFWFGFFEFLIDCVFIFLGKGLEEFVIDNKLIVSKFIL